MAENKTRKLLFHYACTEYPQCFDFLKIDTLFVINQVIQVAFSGCLVNFCFQNVLV